MTGHADGATAPPPTLDDHIPAVGLGKPINRTLWTLIWSIVALIFQAMGITYLFGGEIILPQFIRDAVDYVSGPTTFFVGATIGFAAMLAYRRFVANGLVAWSIVNLFLLYFGLSMTDYDFREIVTKPDNVPIVGLIDSGRLFHLAQPAAGGDQRRPDGPGIAQPGSTRAGQDPDLARPRLHRADLHGGR